MNTEDFIKQLFEVKEKFCNYYRKKDANCPCSCCPICIEERGFGEVDWFCPFRKVKDALTNERYADILSNESEAWIEKSRR